MKNYFIILLTSISFFAVGQIQQNINKNSDTLSNLLTNIDSIRLNGSSKNMEVVLQNGTVESHSISDIINVNFSSESQHSCGAESVHNPNLSYGSMTDQQGNVYKTIVIETGAIDQEWMAENLKTSIYRNGDAIGNDTSIQWAYLTTGAYCYYNNDIQYECPYGKLYNGYAVFDPRNVCPAGWHVPTDAEWSTLTNSIGGPTVAGGKMKSFGTQYWQSPNGGADVYSSCGFSGLPGGNLTLPGMVFNSNGRYGNWWTSTAVGSQTARYRSLGYSHTLCNSATGGRVDGLSVRCLKD